MDYNDRLKALKDADVSYEQLAEWYHDLLEANDHYKKSTLFLEKAMGFAIRPDVHAVVARQRDKFKKGFDRLLGWMTDAVILDYCHGPHEGVCEDQESKEESDYCITCQMKLLVKEYRR